MKLLETLGQAVQADSSPVKTPQESTHFADDSLGCDFGCVTCETLQVGPPSMANDVAGKRQACRAQLECTLVSDTYNVVAFPCLSGFFRLPQAGFDLAPKAAYTELFEIGRAHV